MIKIAKVFNTTPDEPIDFWQRQTENSNSINSFTIWFQTGFVFTQKKTVLTQRKNETENSRSVNKSNEVLFKVKVNITFHRIFTMTMIFFSFRV